MITFFTIPKAWHGDDARRQRNAVSSWLGIGAGVILFGDDPGVREAASELGAGHEPKLTRNENGTPLLDGVFARAHELVPRGFLCFANTDILVGDDFGTAAESLRDMAPLLMIGESRDANVAGDIAPGGPLPPGRKRGAGALDWFLFTRGVFEQIPPFAVGRAAFDNWLVWHARNAGATVVDATPSVRVVHQAHGYGHVSGGFASTRAGAEAAANWRLIGSKDRIYTRYDATHVLGRRGLRRNLGATLRAKERARKAVWKLRHGQLRRIRPPE